MQGLSTEDYKQVMTVVEQAILSTDLAGYFTKKERFVEAADGGEIGWQVRIHKATVAECYRLSINQYRSIPELRSTLRQLYSGFFHPTVI